MDIFDTHAYDRRQKRNTVLFFSWKKERIRKNLFVDQLFKCVCLFLLFPPRQSCALFFSLLPFFLTSGLYFYLLTPDFSASITIAGVKAAPVLLLAVVVLSWNGGQSVLGVVGGLVFSAVGDCCLVWPELFLHGMWLDAKFYLLDPFSRLD